MAKRIYLIDTENVGSIWVKILEILKEHDELLLFYTDNSPAVSYQDLQRVLSFTDRFEFIHCYAGRNGLDFQLVTYLGYLVNSVADAEYAVISNDMGFDTVVRFWTEREKSVIRLNAARINAEYNRIKYRNCENGDVNVDAETVCEVPEEGCETEIAEVTETAALAEEIKAEEPKTESTLESASTNSNSRGRRGRRRAVLVANEVQDTPKEIEAPEIAPIIEAVPEISTEVETPAEDEKKPARGRGRKPRQEKITEEVKADKPSEKPQRGTRTSKNEKTEKAEKTENTEKLEKVDEKKSGRKPRATVKNTAKKDEPRSGPIQVAVSENDTAKTYLEKCMKEVLGPEETEWLYGMLCEYRLPDVGLNKIYNEIIKHFAQEKGLKVYKSLRPSLGHFSELLKYN